MILMLTASLGFTACSEESGVEDPYANWEERNQHYIDSIADVAKQTPGEWKIIRNYKYQPDDTNLDANLSSQFDVNDYVYAKILASAPAESTVSPLFGDTIYVHYRGKMINGTVFDQSFYTDELELEVAQPTTMTISTNSVIGWTTALQYMKVGDRWEIYIPSELGYGMNPPSSSIVRTNSALIFDVTLVKIAHPKGIEPFAVALKKE